MRRIGWALLVTVLLFSAVACTNKQVKNPIANVDSKQPDKVLFDRAMDAMKHNKFDVARLTLQTMINAYPDSEYIARAKLAMGDSWYAEGSAAALTQAEAEYKDFITFFPNMPEAAEAQMKIGDIHYRQMEKPDRDFTHAKRAEEEYRAMIMQYPDSPLVPKAVQRLRDVQEVLADREFGIGRFYYLRESWAAAIARLQSVVDAYPLYSDADEALFLLGSAYERQYQMIKNSKAASIKPGTADPKKTAEWAAAQRKQMAMKERLEEEFASKAADAYSRIITRYPVMPRAEDAKRQLAALGRAIPKPTPEAIAQNKAEEASRGKTGRLGSMMDVFHKHPDVADSAKVGDPPLTDPKQTSATDVLRATNEAIVRAQVGATPKDTEKISVETVKPGTPPPSQSPPRSDTPQATTPDKPNDTSIPELKPTTDPSAAAPPTAQAPTTAQTPAAAPPQVNEVGAGQPAQGSSAKAADPPTDKKDKDKDSSSSKKKKKKKILLF